MGLRRSNQPIGCFHGRTKNGRRNLLVAMNFSETFNSQLFAVISIKYFWPCLTEELSHYEDIGNKFSKL